MLSSHILLFTNNVDVPYIQTSHQLQWQQNIYKQEKIRSIRNVRTLVLKLAIKMPKNKSLNKSKNLVDIVETTICKRFNFLDVSI